MDWMGSVHASGPEGAQADLHRVACSMGLREGKHRCNPGANIAQSRMSSLIYKELYEA